MIPLEVDSSPSRCNSCGSPLGPDEPRCKSCGLEAGLASSDGPGPGALIAGRYELVELVGSGGMGRVFRAIQHPLGTDVCVKTLHEDITGRRHFEARFFREAQALARLRHPNIVAVLDYGTDSAGTSYLAMEYVAGTNLARISRSEQTLDAKRAVRILGQVCDALTAAHEVGVIHRDLKPSNIMVTDLLDQQDFVKVLDFGSALFVGGPSSDRLTHVGTVIGTPVYMAPEYILGRAIDARVDVYAVGVLLYLLLCGTAPFRGLTQAVFAQHVSQNPEPPRVRNPSADVDLAVEGVILRALEKDPRLRYQSAAALKAAMAEALARRGRPVELLAEAEGPTEDTVKERRPPEVEAAIALLPSSPEELATGPAALATDEDSAVETLPRDLAGGAEETIGIAVVRGAYGLGEEALGGLTALAREHGATFEVRKGSVAVALGLVGPSIGPVDAAARWAFAALALDPDGPLRAGVSHSEPPGPSEEGLPPGLVDVLDARDLAEALAAAARPGQVLVSGAAARQLAGPYLLSPIAAPVHAGQPVFELSDPAATAARPEALPFVGRAVEAAALLEVASRADSGLLCVLEGAEGLGKSRLASELSSMAWRQGVLWGVVRAAPRDRLGPEHPLARVAALGFREAGAAAPRFAAPVLELLEGRSSPPEGGPRGLANRNRLVTACVEWLDRRRATGPVVLVLDDLHFADELTWALVERLAEVGPRLGLSTVLAVRDLAEVPVRLPEQTIRLALGPLSAEEVRSLAAAALGGSGDEPTAELVAQRAAGSPLLASEVLRAVRSGLGSPLDRIAGLDPLAALEELVAARVETLSAPAHRLLCSAALLGHSPAEHALIETAGNSEEAMAALVELEAAGLVVRDRSGIVRFPFHRVRLVAAASVSKRELRELHAAAARVIAESAEGPGRRLEIGEHLLAAGDARAALDELRLAAKAAEDRGEPEAAARCLRLATEAARRLGPEVLRLRLEVYRDRGRLLLQQRQLDRADRVLRSGLRRARKAGAVGPGADMLRLHGLLAIAAGQTERGARRLEAALALARKHGFEPIASEACLDLSALAERAGEGRRAAEWSLAGLELARSSSEPRARELEVLLLFRLARIAQAGGETAEALSHLARALAIAEAAGDQLEVVGLLGGLGALLARLGQTAEATGYTERAIEAAGRLGDEAAVARQQYNLALIKLKAGKAEAAREHLLEARDAASRVGWRRGVTMSDEALDKLGQN